MVSQGGRVKEEDPMALAVTRVGIGSTCALVAKIDGASYIIIIGAGLQCLTYAMNRLNCVDEVSINAMEGTTTFGIDMAYALNALSKL